MREKETERESERVCERGGDIKRERDKACRT